jgi:hypothetical protein
MLPTRDRSKRERRVRTPIQGASRGAITSGLPADTVGVNNCLGRRNSAPKARRILAGFLEVEVDGDAHAGLDS